MPDTGPYAEGSYGIDLVNDPNYSCAGPDTLVRPRSATAPNSGVDGYWGAWVDAVSVNEIGPCSSTCTPTP